MEIDADLRALSTIDLYRLRLNIALMIIATIEKRINMAMPVPIKRYLSESIQSAKDPGDLQDLLDPWLNRCFTRVLLLSRFLSILTCCRCGSLTCCRCSILACLWSRYRN